MSDRTTSSRSIEDFDRESDRLPLGESFEGKMMRTTSFDLGVIKARRSIDGLDSSGDPEAGWGPVLRALREWATRCDDLMHVPGDYDLMSAYAISTGRLDRRQDNELLTSADRNQEEWIGWLADTMSETFVDPIERLED